MKTGQWLKAKRSKYKHFYTDGVAVCGSETEPNLGNKRPKYYQYCRKCKNKKAEIEKYALINTKDLARRLVVALLACHYCAPENDEQDGKFTSIYYDLFDEAQAKLDMDDLIPDAQLYKKYLGV